MKKLNNNLILLGKELVFTERQSVSFKKGKYRKFANYVYNCPYNNCRYSNF